MLTTQYSLFGDHDTTVKTACSVNQLSLFGIKETIELSKIVPGKRPISEIKDKITAALIGKPYLTYTGLQFSTGLTAKEIDIGLTELKLSGIVAIKINRKQISEEFYYLA